MATNKKKEAVGRVLTQVRDSQAAMSTAAGTSKGADLSADLEVVWISTMAETYKTDIAGNCGLGQPRVDHRPEVR